MSGRALLTALAVLCLGTTAPARAAEQVVDGIAALVGDDVVLVSEVLAVVGEYERQILVQGGTRLDVARLRAEGLETLIDWRLIEGVVERADLHATDAEIDGTIETIASQNQLSVEQLRDSVTAQGMSYDQYRAEIKREIERRKVMNSMVGPNVRVEEEEVLALFEERFAEQPEGGTTFHVQQILVTHGQEAGRDAASACATVSSARELVAGGQDFQQVAAQVSEVARERGGELGWLHGDSMASWMRKVVAQLEPGQLSPVLELPFACGLVHLVDRTEYQPVSYDQARVALEQELLEKRLTDEFAKWLEEVRERTYIERKGYFAEAARFAGPSSGRMPGP